MRIIDDLPEIVTPNRYVQLFVNMNETEALAFNDYDEMRKAYFSIKSWLRGSKIPSSYRTIDAQQIKREGMYVIRKVNRASRDA